MPPTQTISHKKILVILVLMALGAGIVFLWKNYSEHAVSSKNESIVVETPLLVTEIDVSPVATENITDEKAAKREFRCSQEKPVGARENEKAGDTVIRYATGLTWSTSGEVRFFYYDPQKNAADNRRGNCNWFFADSIITGVNLEEFLDRLHEYDDYVIKIVGMKREDDCGYYQVNNDTNECLESIAIKEMTPIRKLEK